MLVSRPCGALARAILALGLVLCCAAFAPAGAHARHHHTVAVAHHHHHKGWWHHHFRALHRAARPAPRQVTIDSVAHGLANAKLVIDYPKPPSFIVFGSREIEEANGGIGLFADAGTSIDLGLNSAKDAILMAPGTLGKGYAIVAATAREIGVPVDIALALTLQESGGNCRAHSWKGARGILQVEPYTAAKDGFDPHRLYDCEYGARAGLTEMRHLLAGYGDSCRAFSNYGGSAWWTERFRGGCSPYARAVMANRRAIDRAGGIAGLIEARYVAHRHHHHRHWANLT